MTISSLETGIKILAFKLIVNSVKRFADLLEGFFELFFADSCLEIFVMIHNLFMALLKVCFLVLFLFMTFVITRLCFEREITDQKSNKKGNDDRDYHSNATNPSLLLLLLVSELNVVIHRGENYDVKFHKTGRFRGYNSCMERHCLYSSRR